MIIHSLKLKSILENSLDDIEKLWPDVYAKLSFDSKRLGMHIRKYVHQYCKLLCKKQFIVDLSKRTY